ncbi:MAG: hypothetical protein ABSA85_03445 [Terracidiphilus sp.]
MHLDFALWFAYIAIETALLGLLLYRRTWRSLPVFCAYCAWDVLSNIGAFLIDRYYSPTTYFRAYFVQTIIDATLLFCVLVELAWSSLRPLRASLSRWFLLVLAALILIAAAAIWPFTALPGLVHVGRRGHLLAQIQQTVSILRILFFLLLAAASQLLSIGWRDRELQVASGLGVVSIVSLAAAMLHMHQTTASQYQFLGEVVVASYVCCLVYWAYCFSQKQAERREFTPQMQSFLLAVAGAAHSSRVALTDSRTDRDRKPGKP